MSSHFLIRKRKPESRAFPKLGLHSYLAFKLLDDVLRNGQSQSGTLLERIQLHKPIEYILHIFAVYRYRYLLRKNEYVRLEVLHTRTGRFRCG